MQIFEPLRAPPGGKAAPRYLLVFGLPLLLIGIYVYVLWAAATLSYQVDAHGLTVRYGAQGAAYPHSAILAVREAAAPAAARRLSGVALPGLHVGRFSLGQGETVTLYASGVDRPLLLLETAGGPVALSPAEPAELAAALARPPAAAPVFAVAAAGRPAGHAFWTIAMLVLPLMVTGGAVTGLVGHRTLRYEVSDGSLCVRYGISRVEIPLAGIESVRWADPPTGGPRGRGTGLPEFHAGPYRFDDLGQVYLYATDYRKGLVLVRAAGRTYGFSPATPGDFALALQQGRAGDGA